jgi:hypothetical protein
MLATVNETEEGSSPTIMACCAVVKAAKKYGLKIRVCDIASALHVTTVGIPLASKRAEI